MNYFPQLAQFPIRRRVRQRTVVNELDDGRQIKSRDLRPDSLEWQVDLGVLSNAERDEIVALWSACHGARDTFVYVDPTANLLLRSGELAANTWQKDPGVEVSGRIVQNNGQTAGRVWQTVAGPAWFRYCFSFLVRGQAPTELSAIRVAGGVVDRLALKAGVAWSRVTMGSQTSSTEESIQFGIELPPGGRVELDELQLEAQIGNSAYKATTTRGGIHTNARFAADELAVVEEGMDWSSMTIRIKATEL